MSVQVLYIDQIMLMKMIVGRMVLQVPLLRGFLAAPVSASPENVLKIAPHFFQTRKAQIVRLEQEYRGKTLHVREGVVWVTGAETGDLLLHAEDSFVLDERGPFIVEGLTDARWNLT